MLIDPGFHLPYVQARSLQTFAINIPTQQFWWHRHDQEERIGGPVDADLSGLVSERWIARERERGNTVVPAPNLSELLDALRKKAGEWSSGTIHLEYGKALQISLESEEAGERKAYRVQGPDLLVASAVLLELLTNPAALFSPESLWGVLRQTGLYNYVFDGKPTTNPPIAPDTFDA